MACAAVGKRVMPAQRPIEGSQPSGLAVTLYNVPVAASERGCLACGALLPEWSRRDRKYCSDSCRQRQHYKKWRFGGIDPDRCVRQQNMRYSLVYSAARRLQEPVSPGDIALEIRRELRMPFQVERLPNLCARLGCGVPVDPNSRNDRAFCSNACRQRVYRHARRSGSAN